MIPHTDFWLLPEKQKLEIKIRNTKRMLENDTAEKALQPHQHMLKKPLNEIIGDMRSELARLEEEYERLYNSPDGQKGNTNG